MVHKVLHFCVSSTQHVCLIWTRHTSAIVCFAGSFCGNGETCVGTITGEVCGTDGINSCECSPEEMLPGDRCDLYGKAVTPAACCPTPSMACNTTLSHTRQLHHQGSELVPSSKSVCATRCSMHQWHHLQECPPGQHCWEVFLARGGSSYKWR